MKIWHDDVRPAPKGWERACDNAQAKLLLSSAAKITTISLDHDLGAAPSDGIYAKGSSEETGMKLVEWMIEQDLVPDAVIIHSWNPVGAHKMARALNAAGYNVTLAPFEVTQYAEWYDPEKDLG
jgi:hypothetical protein